MTKLYPPITLHQVGQELKVTGYTEEKSIKDAYKEDDPERDFFDKENFIKDYYLWRASKVTLNVHEDSEQEFKDYAFGLWNEGKSPWIDISSLAPRLEVKDNEVFLTPEQPVEESQDDLWSEMTKLQAKCYTECVAGIMEPKDAQELLKAKFNITRK